MLGFWSEVETSETRYDERDRRGRLRNIVGALFGTPGRSAVTSAAALFFVVLGYVVLLPSGIFDDNEFVPTPWEEWGIPGDPPAERPLISEWFDQSTIWQEAERLREMSGVRRAVDLLPEDAEVSEEDFAKALALLEAQAEAAIELTRVAADYSLWSLSEAPNFDISAVNVPIGEIQRAFHRLISMSLAGEQTGREAGEWLDHYGAFIAALLPLGDSSQNGNVVVHIVASNFFYCVEELIARQDGRASDVFANLRRHLATIEKSSVNGIARATYGSAREGGLWLKEHAVPGRAWADPVAAARDLGIYFDFLEDLPVWLGWAEAPAYWWAVSRVQQNRTKALLEDYYREQVQWLQLPASERLASDRADALGWREFLDPRPNAIGERIVSDYELGYIQVLGRRELLTRTTANMLDTTLAIAQWREAGGGPGLPATLAELVPEFLDGIPVDALSGEPLGYDAARGMLWAVGIDGVDSGGVRPVTFRALIHELHREGGSGTLDLWRIFQIEPDNGARDVE